MEERKLATAQIIKNIQPIPNADAIEVATVNGWKVVVKKGEFKVGDFCVYFEIDSFLPIEPEFEFLRPSSFKTMEDVEGFRLKTMKLRKQISQGLVIPISVAQNILNRHIDRLDLVLVAGTDLTEMLGVRKYEAAIPDELDGIMKGDFPSFLRKTDEERIQNLVEDYDELKKLSYYQTEKLDGTSATYYIRDGEYGVCMRNIELERSKTNTFWKVAAKSQIEEKLTSLNRNIAIQGELIGTKIAKNKYKLEDKQIKFFRAFDIDTHEYLPFEEFIELIEEMELETVPILTRLFTLPDTVDELILLADGESKLYKTKREGIVFVTQTGERISFKILSNNFLLKHGE